MLNERHWQSVNRQSPTYAVVTFPKGRHSLNSAYVRSTLYVFTTESSGLPKSKTLESEGPQHDNLTASVIGQQDFFATVFSLRIHSRMEKLAPSSKTLWEFFIL